MAEGDLQKDVRELRKQVEALREALAKVAEPYRELAGYMEQLQGITRGYFRLLDLYAKHGAVSPDVVVPGLKDDISKAILTALFEKGDRNISQITDAVKGKRGTASRRIIRERLQDLVRQGVVEESTASWGHTYRVSEEVAAKWSQVLGLSKYGDQPGKGQDKRGEHDV
jgi:DNA-binding HxlR family transcriptional regulator